MIMFLLVFSLNFYLIIPVKFVCDGFLDFMFKMYAVSKNFKGSREFKKAATTF